MITFPLKQTFLRNPGGDPTVASYHLGQAHQSRQASLRKLFRDDISAGGRSCEVSSCQRSFLTKCGSFREARSAHNFSDQSRRQRNSRRLQSLAQSSTFCSQESGFSNSGLRAWQFTVICACTAAWYLLGISSAGPSSRLLSITVAAGGRMVEGRRIIYLIVQ
jgi:hypothetical protein